MASASMDVCTCLSDIDFTSRCLLQDCYVMPSPLVDTSAVGDVVGKSHLRSDDSEEFPEGVLVSPYLLRHDNLHRGPRPLPLLWRCGACGKEESVVREAMSLFMQKSKSKSSSGKKASSKDTSPFSSSSRHHEPSLCPNCYACPRCNASALSISLSRQLMYVASCSYCHWQHGDACKDLEELLASLTAVSASKMMLPYHSEYGEWRRVRDENKKSLEEASLSISRLANAEYNTRRGSMEEKDGAELVHPAVAMEKLRNAVYCERVVKPPGNPTGLSPPFPALGNTMTALSRETVRVSREQSQEDAEGMVLLLQDNSDKLIKTTQMNQHGFFLRNDRSSLGEQNEDVVMTPSHPPPYCYLLMENIRLPLLAMVIPFSSQHGKEMRDDEVGQSNSSLLFVVNGLRGDPSFGKIDHALQSRSGSENRRCKFVYMCLAAALYLPVLQHHRCTTRGASDTSRLWFLLRNFGDEPICIRRFTVERQVGGVFDSSLVIAAGADKRRWVTLPARSGGRASAGTAFCIDVRRSAGEGEKVMVGFSVEVLTMLPVWSAEDASSASFLLASSPVVVEKATSATAKRQHVVRYGLTISW